MTIVMDNTVDNCLKALSMQGIPAHVHTRAYASTRLIYNWGNPRYVHIIAYGIVAVYINADVIHGGKVARWILNARLVGSIANRYDIVILTETIDAKSVYYMFNIDDDIFYHQKENVGRLGFSARRVGMRKQSIFKADYLLKDFEFAKSNWQLLHDAFLRKTDELLLTSRMDNIRNGKHT